MKRVNKKRQRRIEEERKCEDEVKERREQRGSMEGKEEKKES